MSLKWTIFTQIWPTFSPKPLIQSVSSTQEAIQPAFNQNAYSSQPDICEFLSILGLLDLIQKPKHNQKDHFEPIDGHLDYGGHLVLLRIIPSFQLLGSVTCLCHVLAYWAYLSQCRSRKITRNITLSPSAAILDYGSHLVCLKIMHIIIVFYLSGSVTCLCDVLSILISLDQIQNLQNHQNDHFEPIGGHFGLWRPSCFLRNIQIIIVLQLLGSVTCLCDVLSTLGLLDPIQNPKHHENDHFELTRQPFLNMAAILFFKNHPNDHFSLVIQQCGMYV